MSAPFSLLVTSTWADDSALMPRVPPGTRFGARPAPEVRAFARGNWLKTLGLQERVSGPEPNPRPPRFATGSPNRRTNLLELDLGAGLLELRLDLVGLFFGDTLLDRLRRAFDEVLGLLEAE